MGCISSTNFIDQFQNNKSLKISMRDFIKKQNYQCGLDQLYYDSNIKKIIIQLINIDINKIQSTFKIIRTDLMDEYAIYGIKSEDLEFRINQKYITNIRSDRKSISVI